MELRLQNFIKNVQSLSDLRNLDVFNPIVFQMEHPITATRYTIVGAKLEPSYLGLPINVTWVVLDPADDYYLQALKLKVTRDPDTVSNKAKVETANAWWHVVRTYDEIFEDAQYYLGITGETGPVGPTGAQGETGASGTVDMDQFLKLALAQLATLPGTLEIRGPATIPAAGSSQYEIWLTEPQIGSDGNITTTTRQVYAPISIAAAGSVAIPSGTSIDIAGNLKAGTTGVDVPVKLIAEYPSWTKMIQDDKDVTITSKTIASIAISGAATVYAGGSTTLTCTATYSDGSTGSVSPTWELSSSANASISTAGLLKASSPMTADEAITVTATFGSLTATKAVALKQLQATSITINGSTSIQGGSSTTYTASVVYNSGATATITPTWSLSDTTNASITAAGVLTVSNVAASFDVLASYTVPGTSTPVSISKAITVSKVEEVIYPYFGVGPALPDDWTAFITSLPNRGTSASVDATVEIDCIGNTVYEYFAYPAAYGKASFFDKISNFTGGWGGAGNSGAGPSDASIAASSDEALAVTIQINGVDVPFYVYRTDYANMGAASSNKWLVSAA